MKKITQCATIVCFFALTVTTLFAQDRCGTMDKHKALIGTSSEYRLKYDEALEKSKRKAASRESSSQGLVFKVPVVVHIMHLGEPIGTGSNISDDQVHSAISSMNDAYRKKTGSIYDGNGVDMEIEFCLAQKDPMGNPSSGIVRVNASATAGYNTNGITDPNEITIKALSKWPHNRYYNIWIVSEIDGNNGLSGVQGYAYFAGAPASVDGAVMLYNAFGYDPEGTRNYSLKSYTNLNITCIHELGHAFGLYHSFEGDGSGSTCPAQENGCGDDKGDCCADTPPHKRSPSNCVSGTNDCFSPVSRELFIHNYMDYSSDACQNMFTADQRTRARDVLSPGGLRASLVSESNLIACGCNGNTAPIARFYTTKKQPCEGESIQFIDESLNAPSAYLWTFANGTPITSTSKNPTVSFTGAGPYEVSLKVTSSGGQSHTTTKAGYIAPLTGISDLLPFSESFEGTFLPPNWERVSNDALTAWGAVGSKTWDKVTVAGSGAGTSAAAINLYNYNLSDRVDDLISPMYKLEGVVSPSLTFKIAYRFYGQSNSDTLAVYCVTDCGHNEHLLYKKGGIDLQTTTLDDNNFAPVSAADWRMETIDLSAYAGQRVRILFRVKNGYGENLYLDDVNVLGTYTAPQADFNASKTVDVTNNESIQFYDASKGGISSYVWNFGEGASPATATTAGPHNVVYSTTGTKVVSLTVSGPGGSNTNTKTNYLNVVTSIISSNNLENAGLNVFPNPTNDIVHVNASNGEVISVQLLDLFSNAVIEESNTQASRVELSLKDKPQGIYILLIKTRQGSYSTRVMKTN